VATGLDPAVGFLPTDQDGRPSLALDLIEEFRPLWSTKWAMEAQRRRRLRPEHGRQDDNEQSGSAHSRGPEKCRTEEDRLTPGSMTGLTSYNGLPCTWSFVREQWAVTAKVRVRVGPSAACGWLARSVCGAGRVRALRELEILGETAFRSQRAGVFAEEALAPVEGARTEVIVRRHVPSRFRSIARFFAEARVSGWSSPRTRPQLWDLVGDRGERADRVFGVLRGIGL
jgi:hypothetical protein